MSEILFATRLYKARIASPEVLGKTCLGVAAEDKAGQRWSREHGYDGYTSYASLNDLPRRATLFDDLEQKNITEDSYRLRNYRCRSGSWIRCFECIGRALDYAVRAKSGKSSSRTN